MAKRPSYKTLYHNLLDLWGRREDAPVVFQDGKPTHTVRIYDEIETTYDIVAASDEEANRFDPTNPGDVLILSQARSMRFDRTEVSDRTQENSNG